MSKCRETFLTTVNGGTETGICQLQKGHKGGHDCTVIDLNSQPQSPTPEARPTQRDIDIKNLRWYASLFREHKWEPPCMSWGVFEQTLNEIADRLQSTPPEQRAEQDIDEVFCGCSDYQLSQQLGMYWPDKEGLRTQHTLRLQKIHNTGPECPNPKTERIRAAHPEAVRLQRHSCPEWDYMMIDSTMKEFEACLCFKPEAVRMPIDDKGAVMARFPMSTCEQLPDTMWSIWSNDGSDVHGCIGIGNSPEEAWGNAYFHVCVPTASIPRGVLAQIAFGKLPDHDEQFWKWRDQFKYPKMPSDMDLAIAARESRERQLLAALTELQDVKLQRARFEGVALELQTKLVESEAAHERTSETNVELLKRASTLEFVNQKLEAELESLRSELQNLKK